MKMNFMLLIDSTEYQTQDIHIMDLSDSSLTFKDPLVQSISLQFLINESIQDCQFLRGEWYWLLFLVGGVVWGAGRTRT